LTAGAQLLSEAVIDSVDEVVLLPRDGLVALDLPLRSVEAEFGPGQLELTFAPQDPLRAADDLAGDRRPAWRTAPASRPPTPTSTSPRRSSPAWTGSTGSWTPARRADAPTTTPRTGCRRA
jgi:hypothetical protein